MITTGLMVWIKRQAAQVGVLLASIAATLVSLLYLHNRGKRNAATEAVSKERNRINQETKRQVQKTKERAHEIDQSFADIDRDDLRGRMRNAATDSSDK